MSIVSGKIVEDRITRPGEPWGRVLKPGQVLRIVDLQGRALLTPSPLALFGSRWEQLPG